MLVDVLKKDFIMIADVKKDFIMIADVGKGFYYDSRCTTKCVEAKF